MLAKANRIVSAADYKRLVRTGRRSRGDVVLAYLRRTDASSPMRMGVIVAKPVGKAVVRNRVRRRIKAVGWALARETSGVDVVIRALPSAAAADFGTIEVEVRRAVASLGQGGRA